MSDGWTSAPRLVSLITFAVAVGFVIAAGESMRRHRALAEARKNLLLVTLRSIGDGVITTDAKGMVTDLNGVASNLTGWTLEDARGRSVTEVFNIVNETSRSEVANPVLRALAENLVVGLANHTVLISRTGCETAIDDSAAPIMDGGGRLLGGVLIFRDISPRRKTEAQLLESERRHRFLAELAMATQHLSDAEEIMAANARMLAQFLAVDRCAYAVVEDESIFDITGDYGPEAQSIVGRWEVAAFGPQCVRQMLANEPFVVDDVDVDSRVEGFLPAYRATDIRAVVCVPLHKDGNFTAAMAVHQRTPRQWTPDEVDVVRIVVNRCWESLERARSNRKQKTTAERLTLALAAAQLGDWSWDKTTDLVDLSPRAAEIFGVPSGQQITWATLRNFLNPEDAGMAKRKVDSAAEDGTQYDAEYRVRNGEREVWVAAKGRATHDEAGNARGMFGVVQDVTAKKELEAALEHKANELAAADRQKDDFIALLAHELRNPLAPIRTGLELMRIGPKNSEGVEKVRGMMERQLNHMVRLVDDLLDVSRITRNKLALDIGPVEISKALDLALESVSPMLQALNQRVSVRIPDESLLVWGDFTRLSQVFGNLLANASKFSPQGSSIEITSRVEGPHVRVSVEDHGVGIAAAELPKVFNIFAQAERSLSASKGGLGLGLHLARSLMELQGGSIEASSEGVGRGSTFSVTMPLLGAVDAPASTATDRASSKSALSGLKILVADDNADALEALSLLLETIGARVVEAVGGEAAIAAATEARPDVILMDIGMPDCDGLQATREIRKQPVDKRPIIIALTGWGRLEDREASDAAGADGHVVKPVKLEELESILVPILAGRSS
ncbi:response regulator [Luteolibacter sp. GHJ8]|uniref:histidine kinase n=1 Tax=Luteolibacter rhizosphaerae TaxID=2989719 RepID=A0ABT3FZM7_9BACT|nr:response regulator [Luteolibacter rhizosphaerae]MCW1913048.1 response regulator [Luteolibacter rhizosphaerae]